MSKAKQLENMETLKIQGLASDLTGFGTPTEEMIKGETSKICVSLSNRHGVYVQDSPISYEIERDLKKEYESFASVLVQTNWDEVKELCEKKGIKRVNYQMEYDSAYHYRPSNFELDSPFNGKRINGMIFANGTFTIKIIPND